LSPKYILTSAGAEADLVFESEMRVHSSLLANGEHIQLIWVKFDPDGNYPIHSHPHEQISFMRQERMRLTVGNEVEEIGPGDMWYVPANVLHGGELLGEDPVVFVDIYAPPSAGARPRATLRQPTKADATGYLCPATTVRRQRPMQPSAWRTRR
jgi:quercetin dioxygenase-like cupin family protein